MAYNYYALLNIEVFNNSGQDYLTALIMVFAGIIVLKLVKNVVLLRMKKIAKKTSTDIDDFVVNMLNQLHWPLYFLISVYIALQFLVLPGIVQKIFNYALLIGVMYYIVKAITAVFDYGTAKIIRKREESEKEHEAHVIKTLASIVKGVVWAVAILMVLSNLGFNVTTLVAGLGIGGLAIAFAFQKILEDIFSSISIYFDKPFQVGDFIIVGKHLGVVKKIGIKSTRIQALQGEEIVISNRELTSTRIQNFKQMEKRRIVFGFGVTYDTTNAKLKKAVEIVNDVVKKAKLAELDRVHFKEFGDFSLNFEVVYYLKSKEYNDYMDTQQEINLGLKEAFEKEKIEFAFPTQTVLLSK
ncbi:mechanosensitive ion channel protein MscS [Candidatus Woesearchaeota archaeon]|nr:mechanosensitive ion channel protein MscS [Candidatus Woesearchaeota archaeon]|tara:strand:+ start:348 stop:1412 length:1065 start_codon:yes stop_codon:yes gene_type:complete